jgi:hypothetical protein
MQALWLMQRQSTGQCELLDGALHRSQAAARRAIGLRQDECNIVTGVGEAPERNCCELGCAGED